MQTEGVKKKGGGRHRNRLRRKGTEVINSQLAAINRDEQRRDVREVEETGGGRCVCVCVDSLLDILDLHAGRAAAA